MNRRSFLKMLGVGTTATAAVMALPEDTLDDAEDIIEDNEPVYHFGFGDASSPVEFSYVVLTSAQKKHGLVEIR